MWGGGQEDADVCGWISVWTQSRKEHQILVNTEGNISVFGDNSTSLWQQASVVFSLEKKTYSVALLKLEQLRA